MKDIVSILLPVYNVEKFIQRCAESIFEQTYENLDIVFVDDCSPDNSVKILNRVLERYPHRKNQVRIIRHERNRGVAAARNTAIEAANGYYIMWVDSDDYIQITTVEKCVKQIESYNADVVMFGFNHVFPNKTVRVHIPLTIDQRTKMILSRQTHFYLWNGMYKSELYKKYNIRAIEGINNGEDYAMMSQLIYRANKIVILDEPLYNYIHFNENSYTQSFSRYSAECHVKILAMLRDYFSERGEQDLLESIDIGETMLKSSLLLKWSLKDNAKEHLEYIRNNYHANNRNIPFSKKIILYISRFPYILKVYCRIGFWFKQVIK